jgi:hypothetical protein
MQAQMVRESSRFNVGNCGRRFGKTTVGIHRSADGELLDKPIAWFSPTYKMLLEVWREAVIVLLPITKRANKQERRIELITGGIVEFWSLDNPDTARGRKYARVIVDEAALVPDLLDAWNHVIRPALADYQGDAWIFSTPKGRNGFWQMFQWGQDEHMPEWASWTMPTSANPFIADTEIEAMRQTMPDLIYRQEILAQFVDDAGGVFRHVMEAATAYELDGPEEARQYVVGVDWGRQNDFTVFSVFDVMDRRQVYLDRFTKIDYEVQTSRLRNVYNRFKPTSMIVEYNAMGGPIVERLQAEGLPVVPFITTHKTKEPLIRGLESAFDNGEITILNDPVQVGELQAYEQQQMTTYWKFSAPEGLHDDTVIGMALAWQGITDRPPSWETIADLGSIDNFESRWS